MFIKLLCTVFVISKKGGKSKNKKTKQEMEMEYNVKILHNVLPV